MPEAWRITLCVADVRRSGVGHVSETTYTVHIACHISSWRVICVILLRTKKSDKNSIAVSEQESEQNPNIVHSRSGSRFVMCSCRDRNHDQTFLFCFSTTTKINVHPDLLLKMNKVKLFFL